MTEKIVKVYSTNTCPWCEKTKQFLKQHNIKYEDINVSSDPKLREEIIKKTGQRGVPVIEIGNKIIIGYDEDALSEALKL